MKKILLIALVACLGGILANSVQAQTNIQYHYMVGKHFYKELNNVETPANIMTLEHISGDKWGNNYLFADFTMGAGNLQSVYMQIQRDTKFWKAPIFLHLEYHGGVARGSQSAFNHSYLGGLSWSYTDSKQPAFVSLAMSYKYDQGWKQPHNMSLLASWCWTSWNRLWTLSGFARLNTQKIEEIKSGVNFVAEPQCWLNINQFAGVPDDFRLSIGTEVKMSYSLVAPDRFYVLPTVAAKWTFK